MILHPASPLPLRRRALLQGGAALLVAGAPALSQAQARPGAVMPIVRVPDARIPLELARVAIDSQVAGRVAQTRMEFEVYNPNPQALEGELQFPLLEGQTVTGFALDIDGELRPAVPVDKAKGRQVFDDVIRARIDPALLESTGGNQYKLRVYPLPGRGTRRVVLEIAETLPRQQLKSHDQALLRLPLALGMHTRQLEVRVRFPAIDNRRVPTGRLGAAPLDLMRSTSDGSALLLLRQADYTGRDTLQVAVPLQGREPQVLTQSFRDGSYFYAELPVQLQERPRPAPRRVAVLWDASGSAAQRDASREFALLDAFFQAVPNVEVDLVVVRDTAEAPRRFAVAGGQWLALRDHLRALPHDGATRLEAMAVPPEADLALLFTDGLGTYGDGGLPESTAPLYAFASAAGSDAARLRHAAERAGGRLLDLARVSARDAVAQVRHQATRVLAVDAAGVEDVVFESRYPQDDRLVLAGRLREPAARLTVQLQLPDGTVSRRTVPLAAAPAALATSSTMPVAAYRWATLRLAELEADRERHQQAIRRVGLQFGLATSGTSLIVLDRVEDYARHEIEPPPSLRPAYERLVMQKNLRDRFQREGHLDRVVKRFEEKKAWWDRDFPKDAPPQPKVAADARAATAAAAAESRSWGQRAAPMAPPAPPAPTAALRMAPAPAPMPAAAPGAAPRAAAPSTAPGAADTAVSLKRWVPDSPYARRLRSVPPEQMYAVYLDERPAYTGSTAFFLDCADIFLERGQPELARRILSNLAEMSLENRHVLRLLAYRLLQAGQVATALPALRKVLSLSPDEPQSYRDLGLALAQDGQLQPAVDRLWEVVSRPWNDRFPDIELVALAELNALVARARAANPGALDTSAIDPRLLRNLPLDIRAVLSWDADNTDIDLHVIDPDGQVAYYGKPLTYQGGRMSRDFTGGYGPEEFALKHAKPGTYTVKADFFGHRQQIVAPSTTLMLRFSTGFGTPQQKDYDTVLRLTGEGRQVTVGTFTVGAGQ